MLISPAFAQATTSADPFGGMAQFVPIVLIVVVFYFFLIRPQSKRAKERKAMIDAVRRGDRIVTHGGLIGTIAKAVPDSRELEVDIADNVRVKITREGIADILSKTEPVAAAATEEKKS